MTKHAVVYRMAYKTHLCPWGIKAKHLLKRQGYAVEDRLLASKDEVEAFKAEHRVRTTPQVFIGGTRVGGYEDTRRHFGLKVVEPDATTYKPVLAIFAVAGLLAIASSWAMATWGWPTLMWAGSYLMVLLAVQKLQGLDAFHTRFLGYDLVAQRIGWYGYAYPFFELGAGLLMAAMALSWVAGPVALFIGAAGAASVVKAVYIDGRELACACVGGTTRVPLGPVSLAENLIMVAMGIASIALALV